MTGIFPFRAAGPACLLLSSLLCSACNYGIDPTAGPTATEDGGTSAGGDQRRDAGAPPDLPPFHLCASLGMDAPVAAWSPKGKRFAVTSRVGALHVHDADGTEAYVVNGLGRGLSWPAWSANEALVAAIGGGAIHVLQAADGKEKLAIPVNATYGPLLFSPDGTRVAVLDGGQLLLWNLSNGASVGAIRPPTDNVGRVLRRGAFSPDGKTFAAASYGSVLLWKADNGALLHEWPTAKDTTPTDVAFAPDGKALLASVDDPRLVLAWSLLDYGPLPLSLPQDVAGGAQAITLSQNGEWLALATRDATPPPAWSVEMWRLRAGGAPLTPPERAWRLPQQKDATSTSLSLAPDSSTLLVADGIVTLRSVADGVARLVIDERVAGELGGTMSPHAQELLTAGAQRVDVWDSRDGRHLARFNDGTGVATLVEPTVRWGTALVIASPPSISLRLYSGIEVGRIGLADHAGARVSALAKASAGPAASFLTAAIDTQVVMFPLGSPGEAPRVLATLPGVAESLAFSPDGSLLLVGLLSKDSKVLVLRVDDGTSLGAAKAGIFGRGSASFSPDGRWLALGGLPLQVLPPADIGLKGVSLTPSPTFSISVALGWATGNELIVLEDSGWVRSYAVADAMAAVASGGGAKTNTVRATTVSNWTEGWVGRGTIAVEPGGTRFAAIVPWEGRRHEARVFCRQ